MELNELLAPNETSITGVHQIEVQETQRAPNPPKPSGLCYGCGQSGDVVKDCRNVAHETRNRGNRVPTKLSTHVKHLARRATQRKIAIQAPIGRTDHSGGKPAGLRLQTTFR